MNSPSVWSRISDVQETSIATTQSTLSSLYESERIVAVTLNKLNEQNNKLKASETKLIEADYHAKCANDSTKKLKRLNKTFFLPTFRIPFTKSTSEKSYGHLRTMQKYKRDVAQASLNHEALQDLPQEVVVPSGSNDNNDLVNTDAVYDLHENTIDSNISKIAGSMSRLKEMALLLQSSTTDSNEQINRIKERVDSVGDTVVRSNAVLKRMN